MNSTPDITAAVDQMGATLKSFSEAIGCYRKGLVESGIPVDTADRIVENYAGRLHAMMLPAPNPLGGLFGGAA